MITARRASADVHRPPLISIGLDSFAVSLSSRPRSVLRFGDLLLWFDFSRREASASAVGFLSPSLCPTPSSEPSLDAPHVGGPPQSVKHLGWPMLQPAVDGSSSRIHRVASAAGATVGVTYEPFVPAMPRDEGRPTHPIRSREALHALGNARHGIGSWVGAMGLTWR